MKSKPRLAVVGFGAMGKHHSRNLSEMGDVADFVGIADLSAEARAAAVKKGYPVFASVSDLVRAGVDGVVLAVPTSFHHAVGLELADANLAVLMEKPLAASIQEGEDIIAAMSRVGRPLMVGYVERFNPAIIAAQRLIRDGMIGEPLHIATRRVGTLPSRVKDANVILDIGVHDIDIMSFLLDRPVRLVSAQGGMAQVGDRVDHASLSLDVGGVPGHATVNWLTPVKVRDLTLTGTRGYLTVDYLSQRTQFAPGRDFVAPDSYHALVAQYQEGTQLECPVDRLEPLRSQLETFVRILDGEAPPDPRIALESLRIAIEATAEIEHALRRRS